MLTLRRPMFLAASLLAGLLLLGGALPAAASPQSDLEAANQHVEAALEALQRGDVAGARTRFDQFNTAWGQLEDGVRAADRAAYEAIEDAITEVRVAFRAEPVDIAAAQEALQEIEEANDRFIAGLPAGGAAGTGDAATDAQRVQGLVARLGEGRAAIARGDGPAALAAVRAFQAEWPGAEGAVRAKSAAAYSDTENGLTEALALLGSGSPRLAEADAVLARLQGALAPIAQSAGSYGVFEAFAILLREGLEALLVVTALVAFLKKSGNASKQRWVWGGAGLGIALSVALAFALQQAFSRAGAAFGSGLVEGVVGLGAAVMLFYVSYWLHSKAQLGAWQRYIRERTSTALARGSLVSLALIALLAVLREGAETTVFYLGIAPGISLADLLLGFGLGVLALAAAAVAILALGARLPLRPFFLVSSALIYYLGFKFVGTGLRALQLAGFLPTTPAPVPANDFLGISPTWETTLPQLALLLAGAAVLWLTARRRGAAERPGPVAPAAA